MRGVNRLVISALCVLVIASSCKKSDNPPSGPDYTTPSTYNFTNANYSGQLILLAMADQIGAKINLANTIPGIPVSAQILKDMLNNVNNNFNDSALQLNKSGLKLSDYCSPLMKTDFLNYFDSVGLYSQSAVAAAPGVAGVSASVASPSKKYLLSPNGVFYSQVVKKTLQGLFAYQIQNVYLTDSIAASVNNTTVVAGSGTALEHHWDEAFGFFAVPVNFPTVTAGSRYFGSYSNQVDPGLHSNAKLMTAFLTGRAAITGKDLTTMQKQAAILISTFDSLDAACIVQEMKETDANIDAGDPIAAYGTLSETLGFMRNLKYNTSPKRVITDAQITQLLSLLDPVNPDKPNLYSFVNASVNTKEEIKAKTDAIRQLIGKVYGFSASQLALQ